ncbi:MAG: hypothetical protein NPIRA02_10740 [Nitrospirales bacterium]|nr:MAG: hypothetical protein NPIRA02_10740 [Nitrospirales bacterium]
MTSKNHQAMTDEKVQAIHEKIRARAYVFLRSINALDHPHIGLPDLVQVGWEAYMVEVEKRPDQIIMQRVYGSMLDYARSNGAIVSNTRGTKRMQQVESDGWLYGKTDALGIPYEAAEMSVLDSDDALFNIDCRQRLSFVFRHANQIERIVFREYASGYSMKEIGDRHGVTESRVKQILKGMALRVGQVKKGRLNRKCHFMIKEAS